MDDGNQEFVDGFFHAAAVLPPAASDEVSGWCLKCELPCFLLARTCRGCAGPAIDAPAVVLAAWSKQWRRANLAVEACDQSRAQRNALADERDSLCQRVAALEAALKPFADFAEAMDSSPHAPHVDDGVPATRWLLAPTMADARNARDVLSAAGGERGAA